MNDSNDRIISLLENIDNNVKKLNKDKFLETLYDGLLIGITSGIISTLITAFLLKKIIKSF